MCGIAGFVGVNAPAHDAATRVRAMCDAIRHRGPDSDGYFVAQGVAMGMRRLSVIDVGGGDQPICNEDGTVTVVFNGEIYNHRELRRRLEIGGHRFRTRSDTEVLVHLYEEHGTEMAAHLHGMFAFSIWDDRRRMLLLARDRTGMKPLSYREFPGGLVYCSELRSMWVFDSQSLSVSPQAIAQYLAFGYVPGPSCIFDGVRKLLPGHVLTWSADAGVAVRRYWSPPLPTEPAASEYELTEMLRGHLDSAVASHLESDVPLGAFLSGGLDSSTVVALMSRHAAGHVKTFSIGFAEEGYDESSAARVVAKHFGTDHTELIVRPDVEEIFESVAGMFDEPFADASAIPTFLVSQLARRTVTVALSGDGGDELFGGYARYPKAIGQASHPAGRLQHWVSDLALLLPHVFPGRNRLLNIGRGPWGKYATTVVQPLLVAEGGVAARDLPGGRASLDEMLLDHVRREVGEDFAAAIMLIDIDTYLPGDILTKVDRTSMAVSLEARVPLLDAALVDFALGIPGRMRVSAHETKRLFRRAIRGLVPDFVLSRPKRGFELPLTKWFRSELRHRVEALRTPSAELRTYVDLKAVRRLVFENGVGRRDHSVLLWRLIALEFWFAAMRRGRLAVPPSVPQLRAAEA